MWMQLLNGILTGNLLLLLMSCTLKFLKRLQFNYVVGLSNFFKFDNVTDLGIVYNSFTSFKEYYVLIAKRANYLIHSLMSCFRGHNTEFHLFFYIT